MTVLNGSLTATAYSSRVNNEELLMKRTLFAATLVAALITSTAALAAPNGDTSDSGYAEPGAYFSCVIPLPGKKSFRTGACWLDNEG